MNKHYISKLKDYFKDDILWENLKENLKNLKKFKKSKKKKFYIRSKYPHRRSIAKYKSYVTLKRYLTKDCR